MVGSSFFPFGEKSRKERVYNFFIVSFSVPSEFSELATTLDKDGDLGGQGAVSDLGLRGHQSSGNLWVGGFRHE